MAQTEQENGKRNLGPALPTPRGWISSRQLGLEIRSAGPASHELDHPLLLCMILS